MKSKNNRPVLRRLVALVSVINIRPSGLDVLPFSADGTFRANGVPDGNFVLCPRVPNDLLSPCAWEATWPCLTVTQSQTVTMPTIQLKRGVHLSIRADDPPGKRASM